MSEPIRILTNHPGQAASPTWSASSTLIRVPVSSASTAWKHALRLYCSRRSYDCMVLGAWPVDLFLGIFQTILPFRKIPTVLIDCLWYEHRNLMIRLIKKAAMRLMDRSVDHYVVWASREIETYSKAFGLKRHKLSFVPYHTTLDSDWPEPEEGNFIFAGGSSGRDYATFLEAVDGVPASVEIACQDKSLFSGLRVPSNVAIRSYPHAEYVRRMARCLVNVVPLAYDPTHSPGQQTFLNSMYLGKPTIVTDPEGAGDYITDGEDGILVPPADSRALRKAILWVLDHPSEAKEMGVRAKKRASAYTTEEHFRKIVALAHELIEKKKNSRDMVKTDKRRRSKPRTASNTHTS